jgi:putative ABC transport system permease protein
MPQSKRPSFLKRATVEQEVDDEFAFHVEMTIQSLIDGGMRPEDARAEAVRRFGDIAVVAAECRRFGHQRDRHRARAEYTAELRQDLTFALRQLGRARSFAAIAIGTLALGIGATAAVFSALHAVVLNPLPFADADRVVKIMPVRRDGPDDIVSASEVKAMREMTQAFSGVAAARTGGGFTLTGFDTPEVIEGASVSHEYFRVIGVSPVVGRGFVAADDEPGAPNVVLLSHQLWTRRFLSDTSLIGKRLTLHDEPYTVIGVLPASLDETGSGERMWVPLRLTPQQYAGGDGRWLRLVARLAPGVSLEQAADAATAAERVAAQRTQSTPKQPVTAVVRRYQDVEVGDLRTRLFILLGAVGFVLLIACVNVANLLLARGTVRARELAIRAALGAGRARLLRQLLAESVLLSLAGALGGVLVAIVLVKALVAVAPDNVPRLDQARVNGVVLAFTLGIGMVSSLLIGIVPALRSAGPALQSSLRDGARGAGTSGGKERLRATLVAAEVALALALLVGAGLLIRTAWQLQHVDPGFNPSNVMTARILLPASRYASDEQIVRTFEQIRTATEQVPGVKRAALTSVVPLSQSVMTTSVTAEGRVEIAEERTPTDIRFSSPGYFDAMGMKLLDGRDIQRADDATAMEVAVISASLAKKLWPGERAVGKRIDAMRKKRNVPNLVTVVGVVSDVHDAALNAPAKPTMYFPFTQVQPGFWPVMGRSLVLVAQTTPKPESFVRELRRAVMSVDPSLPLADDKTMEGFLSGSVARARFNTLLLTTLGAIALLLASVGVYGVVSYFVSQRTREIGVRMALGAAPAHIWRLVLRRGMTPILWGAAVGIALSLATARLLREQLYGVSPDDPVTLATVGATLLAVALVATIVPARRAMRVTPLEALAAD